MQLPEEIGMTSHNPLALLALAGGLAVSLAVPLAAQTPGQTAASAPRPERFARLVKLVDKDGDGAISLEEAQGFAAQRFDRLDTEHKGYLTLEAYEAPLRRAIERASEARRPALERALPRADAAFKALNKAGDGRLTKQEFLADSRARFAAADTDKDGKLTIDELRHARGHAF
jgi:Ca2+-binding EF-hand superfamily protein